MVATRVFFVGGDSKSAGKKADKTGNKINGIEMETKSSSHRASRGSSWTRGSAAAGQWPGIVAELLVLAAGWSAGGPAHAVAGPASPSALAAVLPPAAVLLLWACAAQ